jgi:predicted nucleic acid-binding protein
MVKQSASIDASFWINACRGDIILHVADYFYLFASTTVAAEIRYPLDVLGMAARSCILFNAWVQSENVVLQDPRKTVSWFQPGENAAIALAIEQRYFLLIDDANPYHRARAAGLQVVGMSEFVVLLFDHGRLTYTGAVDAIKQTNAGKQLKRTALTTLETVAVSLH